LPLLPANAFLYLLVILWYHSLPVETAPYSAVRVLRTAAPLPVPSPITAALAACIVNHGFWFARHHFACRRSALFAGRNLRCGRLDLRGWVAWVSGLRGQRVMLPFSPFTFASTRRIAVCCGRRRDAGLRGQFLAAFGGRFVQRSSVMTVWFMPSYYPLHLTAGPSIMRSKCLPTVCLPRTGVSCWYSWRRGFRQSAPRSLPFCVRRTRTRARRIPSLHLRPIAVRGGYMAAVNTSHSLWDSGRADIICHHRSLSSRFKSSWKDVYAIITFAVWRHCGEERHFAELTSRRCGDRLMLTAFVPIAEHIPIFFLGKRHRVEEVSF